MIQFITEQYFVVKALMAVALGWGFGLGLGIIMALLIMFKERVRDYFDPPTKD